MSKIGMTLFFSLAIVGIFTSLRRKLMHIRKPDEILSQKHVLFMQKCLFENLVSFGLTLTRPRSNDRLDDVKGSSNRQS